MSAVAERRGTPALLFAVPFAAAVVGALLALALSRDDSAPSPPQRAVPRTVTVAAGPVKLAVRGNWTRGQALPGLTGGPATGLRSSQVAVTIAQLPPSHPSLLPRPLAARMAAGSLRPQVERHGALRLWHFAGVPGAPAGRAVDAYVAPTTKGIATVTCAHPAGRVDGCDRALAGLRLDGASARPLVADAAVRQVLPATVAALNRRRAPARAALARARTPRAAAAAAERLTGAHLAAYRGLLPLASATGAGASATRLLGRLSFEYRTLAISLRRRNDRAVRSVGRRIATDEQRLAVALTRAG